MKRGTEKPKRSIAILTMICMILTLIPMSVQATEFEDTTPEGNAPIFTDVSGHWGQIAIEKWSEQGIVNGYNGLFRPDDSITRGEMAVILNNLMDYQVAATNTFPDLKAGQFYTDAILKANASGIILGDGVTVRPLDKITREEAAVMFSKAFAVPEASSEMNFSDVSSISVWAKNAVAGMAAKGYVIGYTGKFDPKANVTRAAVVTMINNIVKAYYTKAGTYKENVTGTAVIKAPGVVLKDVTIDGNLIIAEGVGQGDATLDGVTIKGETVVRGGGENSIHIIGSSSINSIRIERIGDMLRIVIAGGLTIQEIEVAAGEKIIITGTVGTLELSAEGATVYATSADINITSITGKDSTIIVGAQSTINSIQVSSSADNTTIQTEAGAVVKEIYASAPITVSGTGTVSEVELNEGASGSTITSPNTVITVGDNVTDVTGTGGTAIPAGETGTNGNTSTAPATIGGTPPVMGGGGGGSPQVTVPISDIIVAGNAIVGETLSATPTPSDATGNYQWQVSTDDGATWENIPTNATSSTYNIASDYAGNLIRARITGTGSYTGTQTSAEKGPIIGVYATISGTVSDFPGGSNTLGGIVVNLYGEDDWEYNTILGTATAAVDGSYTIDNSVGNGGYVVRIEAVSGSYGESKTHVTVDGANITDANIILTSDAIRVTVVDSTKSFYGVGEILEFTIGGLAIESSVTISMPIHTGAGGWPWVSDEEIINGMELNNGARTWTGTTNAQGELIVSGVVQTGLPSGHLHVTIPAYGITIDNALGVAQDSGVAIMVGPDEVN